MSVITTLTYIGVGGRRRRPRTRENNATKLADRCVGVSLSVEPAELLPHESRRLRVQRRPTEASTLLLAYWYIYYLQACNVRPSGLSYTHIIISEELTIVPPREFHRALEV